MKVILLSAKAQFGKDTTANILKDLFEQDNKKVLIAHYADLLKYMCKHFFDWNGIKDDKGRTILQYVGTDVIRNKQPNYWVDFIISVLNLFEDEWDYVLIPDTRFPNEIDIMKKSFDTIALRIERDGFDNGLSEEQKNHISEIALDDYKFDYIVNNNGTYEDLIETCKEVIKWII